MSFSFKGAVTEAGGAVPALRRWESQEDGNVDHRLFQGLDFVLGVELDTNIKALK